jgi:hypothetical protein
MKTRRARGALLSGLAAVAIASCFDSSTRWEEAGPPPPPPPPVCIAGQERCTSAFERCTETPEGGVTWTVIDDCAAQGLVCAPSLLKCTTCIPDSRVCQGQEAFACSSDGSRADLVDTCDTSSDQACRAGACVHLCSLAAIERSNVGCEYWAVDLDNAMIDATSNASAQQFAVVISNPQPDVAVQVRIYQDDGDPGDAPAPIEIASSVIAPLNLQVFKLGPREVDGSPEGEYNTGTHTALTRHAYKLTSNFPVVVYQFNPLENVNVFSNDASLLKPREAYTYEGKSMLKAYVVAGWPQTIAATDDPNTNFNPFDPIHLRAFLTIVGTQEDTTVRVKTKAAIVAGGPVPATPVNGTVEMKLGAFDVLNLETGDFNADFTGSIIEADGPIAVFTGSEASDAPHFPTLAERRCCADHLEDQLDSVRTAGKRFAIAHSPSRTRTVMEAGALTSIVPEPEYVRFVAASNKGAVIKTTLPPPDDSFALNFLGDFREVRTLTDFMAESTEPVIAMQVMASQDAAGVKRGLPGGDPSITIVPPMEQFRRDYVFLTPDKYAFDFISVAAAPGVSVFLDDAPLDANRCWITPGDGLTAEQRGSPEPPLYVYSCQLSFAAINPLTDPPEVTAGLQNDGVHRLTAGEAVGVLVTGFDAYVSYAYAAGTELREISPPE